MSRRVQIDDPKNDDVPDADSSPVQTDKLCLKGDVNTLFFGTIPSIPSLSCWIWLILRSQMTILLVGRVSRKSTGPVEARFEYNAASDLVKEIEFEEAEGGVKTRILRK